MLLNSLILQNFRLHLKKKFTFSPSLTVIVGPNTSGKTNILEAIFMLAIGKSFRAEKDNEVINFQDPLARVIGEIKNNQASETLEIIITRGELYGKKIATKKYLVNQVAKRTLDFIGKLKVCLFWPQDLELVTDTPSVRRRYLDFVLTQIDREYLRNLRLYEKGLRARNKLLERIRDEGKDREELDYWDNLVITAGSYLSAGRSQYINYLNKRNFILNGTDFRVEYDLSIISQERLKQYQEAEIASATTLVGPHRDDFKFKIQKERDLSLFGSRGEQRLGVLWLKLGELAYLEKKAGEKPILLLDDIFSEFDHYNRQLVFQHIGNQQTIITTTDIHLIEKKLQEQAEIIELSLE